MSTCMWWRKRTGQCDCDIKQAKIERLQSEADEYQQLQDEIIVALGSKGILPSEIVAKIERLQLRIELLEGDNARLCAWLLMAPHELNCASLTPRPQSISMFFEYRPPNCDCYKARFVYEQEIEARSDHEFSY